MRLRCAFVLICLALASLTVAAVAGTDIAAPVQAGSPIILAWEPAAPANAWRLALEPEDSLPDAAPPLPGRVPRVPDIRPTAPRPPACASWPAPIPILLLTQRQNE